MKTFSRLEIADAAQQREGFCLVCGHRQDFLEKRLVLGLCEECGEQEVLNAEILERAINLEADAE